MEILEYAYAKVNLTLRILPDRGDGFHGVETIMAPIDLYDVIKVKENDSFKIEGVDIPNNIMERVAKIFFEKYHLAGKVLISIEKNIPVAAGLAGGSSDAAATLRALNRFYKLNLPLSELEEICNMVGSDVSYCLYQKLSYCTGRGEIVEVSNVSFKPIPLLLIKPNFSLSTGLVYKHYIYKDRDYDKNLIFKALTSSNIKDLETVIFNDLEEPSCLLAPQLKDLVLEIKGLGFEAFQSGSGPSYFVLNPSNELILELKAKHPDYFILKTSLGI